MSDADAPATIQELRMRMRQLHKECGAPTGAAMRNAIKEFAAPRLAPASLSEFFSNKRPNALPKQDFLRGFVAACLLYRGETPQRVTTELLRWDTWWALLVLASGTPPVTIAPRVPDPTPNGADNRTGRARPILFVAGLVAGLALGAGTAVAIPALFRTHDAHPAQLRADIGRPPTPPTSNDHCPMWEGNLDNGRGQRAGSIWYRECVTYLDVVVADNLTDGYCISTVIHWPTGQSETILKTCPGGHLSHAEIPKTTPDFTLELVADRTGER
jgi:hypothetical protein